MAVRTHPRDAHRVGAGDRGPRPRPAQRRRGRRALYRESIERLGRTRVRAELARAHLLYGEWLRRERRRADAREQLRTAHDMLDAMGMGRSPSGPGASWWPPARPPASARRRPPCELTAQEAQVARLARDGLSNPEIGARLFISPRTVQYHLGKVFTKLGISSRSQLDQALPADPDTAPPLSRTGVPAD